MIGGISVVGNYIWKSVACLNFGNALSEEKMADHRVLRPRRKEVSLEVSQAIHLETANVQPTDSFINEKLIRE